MLNEKHRFYYVLGGIAITAGILFGSSELIFLGFPFIIMAFVPLLGTKKSTPQVKVSCLLDRPSLTEGEAVRVTLQIETASPVPLLEITHILQGPGFNQRVPLRYYLSVAADESRTVTCDIKLDRRGRYILHHVQLRYQDEYQLIWTEGTEVQGHGVLVYPRFSQLKLSSAVMRKIGKYSGNYVSRFAGEGTELADIRHYQWGDMAKHINWKVSLKRAGFRNWETTGQAALAPGWGIENLYVNARLEERNADVVLILDAMRNSGTPPNSYLDIAARGTASLAKYFLDKKDRVGLMEYHGTVSWLRPASGQRQLQRILRRLAVLQEVQSYVFQEFDEIPRRALPASAQLYVFTPLIDERSMWMLVSLALQGFRPLVIYVPVTELTASQLLAGKTSAHPMDQLALRWWQYEQKRKLRELRRSGLMVVTWDGSRPIDFLLNAAAESRWR